LNDAVGRQAAEGECEVWAASGPSAFGQAKRITGLSSSKVGLAPRSNPAAELTLKLCLALGAAANADDQLAAAWAALLKLEL
jgi:hypothetical protein